MQFETGNQKGGNYFCMCGLHVDKVDELDHAFRCPYWSLEKRRLLVMAGPIGQTNSLKQKLKPFENLTVKELDQELLGRGILRKEFL